MQRHKVLVFDLGGGTFDTVLLSRSSDVVEVQIHLWHVAAYFMSIAATWHQQRSSNCVHVWVHEGCTDLFKC